MDTFIHIPLIGIGATLIVDLWGLARKQLFAVPAPDYGLVGRWIAYMPQGQFHHDAIATSKAIRGERLIGWSAHYFIGILFAAILVGICGFAWLQEPTIEPALVIGICTVTAPFYLMQPGMGAGIASSRTRNPASARIHSMITHAIFGGGLYAATLLTHNL